MYRLGFVAATCALLLLGIAFPIAQPFSSFPPGTFNNRAALDAGGAAPAFQGMADIVASPIACWSLQACSAADRGNKVVNACNSTGGVDVGCADLVSDATTGKLVPATVSSITCPGANCTIKIWYDRSLVTSCAGSVVCDLTQLTVASRPTLVANCNGTLPCARCSGSQSISTTVTMTQGQPLMVSYVASQTAGFTSNADVLDLGGAPQVGYGNATNTAFIFAGSSAPTATAANSALHAIQNTINGASSEMYIDGSGSTVSPGATGASNVIGICGISNFLTGDVEEVGIWAGTFSGGQKSSMNTNQHSVGRWNF